MNFTVLQYYAIISLGMTLLFLNLNVISTMGSKIFRVTIKDLLKKSSIIEHMVFVVLMISRKFLALSEPKFNEFAIFSAVLLFLFNFTRFYMILGLVPKTPFWSFVIFIIYIVAFINTLLRLSINLGNSIDSNPDNNIVYVWEHIPKLFRAAAPHMQQHTSQSPIPNVPLGDKLKRYGLWAGIIMVPIVGYSTYELHLSRKAAELSAKAAELSANAAQQKTDIKAVQAGLMSKENYHNKYPS